jgi:hypothetical protein
MRTGGIHKDAFMAQCSDTSYILLLSVFMSHVFCFLVNFKYYYRFYGLSHNFASFSCVFPAPERSRGFSCRYTLFLLHISPKLSVQLRVLCTRLHCLATPSKLRRWLIMHSSRGGRRPYMHSHVLFIVQCGDNIQQCKHQEYIIFNIQLKYKSVALFRKRTIPTERPPLLSAKLMPIFAAKGCRVVSATDPHGR